MEDFERKKYLVVKEKIWKNSYKENVVFNGYRVR